MMQKYIVFSLLILFTLTTHCMFQTKKLCSESLATNELKDFHNNVLLNPLANSAKDLSLKNPITQKIVSIDKHPIGTLVNLSALCPDVQYKIIDYLFKILDQSQHVTNQKTINLFKKIPLELVFKKLNQDQKYKEKISMFYSEQLFRMTNEQQNICYDLYKQLPRHVIVSNDKVTILEQMDRDILAIISQRIKLRVDKPRTEKMEIFYKTTQEEITNVLYVSCPFAPVVFASFAYPTIIAFASKKIINLRMLIAYMPLFVFTTGFFINCGERIWKIFDQKRATPITLKSRQ